MSDKLNLESVQKLFQNAQIYNDMERPQQAAFKATLKRFLGRARDPQIKIALQKLAEYVGESKPPYKAVSADDVLAEYREKYPGYDAKKKGNFKSKVTRMVNVAKNVKDETAIRKLAGIKIAIKENEDREIHASIIELASLLPEPADNDLTEEE